MGKKKNEIKPFHLILFFHLIFFFFIPTYIHILQENHFRKTFFMNTIDLHILEYFFPSPTSMFIYFRKQFFMPLSLYLDISGSKNHIKENNITINNVSQYFLNPNVDIFFRQNLYTFKM